MVMGRLVMECCLNAIWLVPVVAGAGWLLVKIARLRPAGEHRVWLGALVVCLALPALGIKRPQREVPAPAPDLSAFRFAAEPEPVASLPVSQEVVAPVAVQVAAPDSTKPSPREWLARRLPEVPMAPRVVAWFGWVYAGVVGFAALRLVRVWWSARRLVREANPYAMSEAEYAVFRDLCSRFGVKPPPVLLSQGVRSPVVVGLSRTVLLLPRGFAQYSEAERRAALCHELAHVRRRDCQIHAGVQLLTLPLVWHPATHFAARRVARTREMACDEMAAETMSPGAGELTYARCLLNLARKMVGEDREAAEGVGLGLFRTNKLEERVMRLTEAKRVLAMQEVLVRRAVGVAVAGMVLVGAAMVHVAPVVAQESAPVAPAPLPTPAKAAVPTATPVPIVPTTDSAPGAPSVSAIHPVPQAAPSAPPAVPEPEAVYAGSSVGAGPSGTAVGTDVFVDDHFAVARGQNAHVQVPDGRYLHRWVGADGEPYESADENPGDLSAEQKRSTEAEFARRMA